MIILGDSLALAFLIAGAAQHDSLPDSRRRSHSEEFEDAVESVRNIVPFRRIIVRDALKEMNNRP
jgi:hypothetical protein